MVEWLTNDELLIHGGGALAVMDLRSEPPKITDVIQGIFLLDVAYPDDFSSMASMPDKAGQGYHLAVHVNHPRNQAVYLYHSETGQVEVLQSDVDMLLFFPDGEWTELPKFEATPTYRDEYELVWVDTPEAEPQRLVVQGHVPRNYPDLNAEYLPGSSQMVFSSSQGVSLVSIPDGALLGFWELAGGSASPSTFALASPDGKALVAIVERVGLYYIPLPNK